MPVGRVWQDVDEAENDACFPSLALEKISSVPPYDRCFHVLKRRVSTF